MARTLPGQRKQRKGLAYRSTTKGRSTNANSSSVDRLSIRSMTGASHKAESSIARSYPLTMKVPQCLEAGPLVPLFESVGECNTCKQPDRKDYYVLFTVSERVL